MRENVYLNHEVPDCQITNKVNKERDKRKTSISRKSTQANLCVR